MPRVALFEDSRADQLRPLTLTRPVFELLSGLQTNRERVLRQLATTDWCAFCRADLAETYREAHPGIAVNDERAAGQGPVLFVNGRYIPAAGALANAAANEAGYLGDTLCYVTVNPDEAILLRAESLETSLAQIARDRKVVAAQGRLIERPWELIHHNGEQITADYRQRAKGPKKAALGSQVAILGEDQDVHVDPTAQIDPASD